MENYEETYQGAENNSPQEGYHTNPTEDDQQAMNDYQQTSDDYQQSNDEYQQANDDEYQQANDDEYQQANDYEYQQANDDEYQQANDDEYQQANDDEYQQANVDYQQANDDYQQANDEYQQPNDDYPPTTSAEDTNSQDVTQNTNNNPYETKEENQTSPSPPPSNHSTEASEPTQAKENRFYGKIFVGGLGRNTTEESLKEYFQQFGPISESNVIVDKASRRSRGFGFITFETDAAVKKCLQQKHYVDEVKVDVRNAVPREEAKENLPNDPTDHPGRVFVGGLSEEVSEDQFKEFFQQFGPLKSSNLMYDKDHHKPRGFGFVIFEKPEDADKSLGTHEALGRNCEAKKALPKPTYTRPKPIPNTLWNPHPYLHISRPMKQTQRMPPIPPYREPTIYDPVDPYYLSAYPYDPHVYSPQSVHPYYPPTDPMLAQQGYTYGYAHTASPTQFSKYPPPSRTDVYTPMDPSLYGADRQRRNLVRSQPY